MNKKAQQFNTFQQIRDEFTIIALTALIATVAVWVYVSINLLWTAVAYLGFLLVVSVIYGSIDYVVHRQEVPEQANR
jgi:hypothetical protein